MPAEGGSEPKNHHYIPQCILRGFSCFDHPKRIWVYEKAAPVICCKKSIKRVACEIDFHTIERPDGTSDRSSVETMLSQIEHHQIEWIRATVRRGFLEETDRGEVAAIFNVYRCRVPQFKENVSQAYESVYREMMDGMIERGMIPFPADMPESERQEIREKKSALFDVGVNNGELVRLMISTGCSEELIQKTGQMGFSLGLVEDEAGFLCISDCPVSEAVVGAPECRPEMLGPGSPYMEMCMPITQKACLIAQWRRDMPPMVRLGAAAVKELNRRTAAMASRFVFSPDQCSDLRGAVERAARRTAGLGNHKIPVSDGAYFVMYTMPVASGMKLVP